MLSIRDFIYGAVYFYAALAYFDRKAPLDSQSFDSKAAIAFVTVATISVFEHFSNQYIATQIINNLSLDLNEIYRRTLEQAKFRDGFFRSQVFYTHPIVLGQLATVGLALGLVLAQNRRTLATGALICVSATITIWTTGSRSAVLVGVAIFILSLSMRGLRSGVGLFFLIWVISIGIIIFGDDILRALQQLIGGRSVEETLSSQARNQMWNNAADALIERPILGFGSGQAVMLAGIYSLENNLWTIDDLYLSILLDYGSLGMLMLLILIGSILYRGAVLFLVQLGSRTSDMQFLLIALVGLLLSLKATSITEALPWIYLVMGALCSRPIDHLSGNAAIASPSQPNAIEKSKARQSC